MDSFTLLALIAPIVAIMVVPVSSTIKVIFVVIFLMVAAYVKRGYIYLVLGTNIINNSKADRQKGWQYFEKGWKAGLSASSSLMVANLFVNHKDPVVALKIFESLLSKRELKIREGAMTGKALSLWVLGSKKEALEILRDLFNSGHINKSVALNLSSYLIELELYEEAQTVLEKSLKVIPNSYKLLDLKAYLFFLTGFINRANEIYLQLFTERVFKFPEIYYHAAEVAIDLGEELRAKNYLNEALNHPFLQTSVIDRDKVADLLSLVGDSIDNDGSLAFDFYDDEDLFIDEHPVVEEEFLEIGLHRLLDPDDYYYEEEHEMDLDFDEQPSLESSLFEDEYEDDEQELDF